MLVSVGLDADFQRGCADRGISHLLFATHPYPQLSRTILRQHTVSSSVALIHPVRSKRIASTI
jgi:hypothetical protein